MNKVDEFIKENIFKIMPAGRHLLTIGRDLIQDQYAAIVELVKNAYDADSPEVQIEISKVDKGTRLKIIVSDSGHGMSRDTVIHKWLVPSTKDKKDRKFSPKERVMQGRKGVGRYAASILGEDLLLETVDNSGEKTTVFLEWAQFEKAEYLSDVEVIVETIKSDENSGTRLTITGGKEYILEWDKRQIDKLNYELKKLIPPVSQIFNNLNEDRFDIFLTCDGFSDEIDRINEEIKPYPIFNLFDYRISGNVNKEGKGVLSFMNQKARNTVTESIDFDYKNSTSCGSLEFDLRVYDREPDAIDQLIQRGLKDDDGNYTTKLQARQILNDNNGIGVYRNGFRIRPMGDPDFDWLKLNEQRIQNPSQKIGSNQVIGYVQIQSEELSHLEEKSARDGLKENGPFRELKTITLLIIKALEERRLIYRQKAGLSRNAIKIEKEFEKLFSFDHLKERVRKDLKRSGISKEITDSIVSALESEEKQKNLLAEEIKQTVAIYQGQATLGKIINVILHEGRRPLNYFKNQIPNLHFWADELKKQFEQQILDEIIPISKGLGTNAQTFVHLFSRLDPLAAKKRSPKKPFLVRKTILQTFEVFENELINQRISYSISGHKDIEFNGWGQDFYIIFTNLIDNSLFWIVESDSPIKNIQIEISGDSDVITYIDYKDSGPGIEEHLIESGVIFDPEFSTKPGGTGLGLAIAGEAALRNGLELKSFKSDKGAYFRLQPLMESAR